MRLLHSVQNNTEFLYQSVFSVLIYFMLFLHISSVLLETWEKVESCPERGLPSFLKTNKQTTNNKKHNIESTGRKTKVLKQKQRVVVSETYSPSLNSLKRVRNIKLL